MTLKRLDSSHQFVFERFQSGLLNKALRDELTGSARTFRDYTSGCWDVPASRTPAGQIHHTIIIEGIRVGGQVWIVARTTRYVTARQ